MIFDWLWLWAHRRHGTVQTGLSTAFGDVTARGWMCSCGAAK